MKRAMLKAVALVCAFVFTGMLCLSGLPAANAVETSAKHSSIFVATDRHEAGNGNNLTTILQQVAADADAVLPTVTLLGGDNVGEGPDAAPNGQPVFSLEDVNGEITSVLGSDITTYYTFGSHDNNVQEGYDAFLSGPAACDGYYIYGISYAQMLYATDEQAEAAGYHYIDAADSNGISAESASAKFLSWVESLDDNMPIIFMSHVPMHVHRMDNLGAATWCEALNKAAETHDVIALFGHNHSQEALNSTDRPYYLVPAGSSMPVQGADKAGDYSEPVTLNFTYMNAGYLTLGYGTLMTFSDLDLDGDYDELTIQRYSTTGKDVYFGDTGIESPYTISLTQWTKQSDDSGTEQPDSTDPVPGDSEAGRQDDLSPATGDETLVILVSLMTVSACAVFALRMKKYRF